MINDSLLYVAEKKKPKTFPFLSQGEVPDSAQVKHEISSNWQKLCFILSSVQVGTEYAFREEWGEQVDFHQKFCPLCF